MLTCWQVVMLACWYADTGLLKRLLPDALRRWHGDVQAWRHSDLLTFWHADRLVCLQTHWWRHPEDTLMLTFWHNDMQTSRHGDLLTVCWRANMLTCRYANVQACWCWHTDLLLLTADMLACRRRADMWLGWRANMVTCRYANVLTRWQAGLLTCWHWNVQTRWQWTYCHSEMLTRGLCEQFTTFLRHEAYLSHAWLLCLFLAKLVGVIRKHLILIQAVTMLE